MRSRYTEMAKCLLKHPTQAQSDDHYPMGTCQSGVGIRWQDPSCPGHLALMGSLLLLKRIAKKHVQVEAETTSRGKTMGGQIGRGLGPAKDTNEAKSPTES